MSRTLIALAAVIAWNAPARADGVPIIPVIPTEYTPGTTVSFEIRVPGLIDFSAYSMQLVFSTDIDNPDLTVSAAPDLNQYPFPTVANFQSGPGGDFGLNALSLVIADSTSPPVNTNSGFRPDQLATITLAPGGNMTGPIRVRFEDVTIQQSDENPQPINPPAPFIINQAAPQPAAVPAPAGWLLLGIGWLGLAARRRFGRG